MAAATTDPKSPTMNPTGPLTNPSRPTLPPTFAHTTPQPTLHYQGAEALLYRTYFPLSPSPSQNTSIPTTITTPSSPSANLTATSSTNPPTTLPAALKHRPPKPYRHPLLDAKLTRHRILSEARALVRLRREGLGPQIPAVYALDWEQGWMLFEWVEGETVRRVLDGALAKVEEQGNGDGLKGSGGGEGEEGEKMQALYVLMGEIGRLVAKVHEKGVIHGDLTTSNLMVRRSTPTQPQPQTQQETTPAPDVVLIDFGLAAQSTQDEDRAVDLYVLERAFGSTHPRTEGLWGEVLRAYGEGYKGAKGVVKRLEEVRMRGRKKIMIG